MVNKRSSSLIDEKELKKEVESTSHKCILVICAHSDDQVLGPGGTLAKYSKEGAKIITIILSYGELTPAWIKHKYTIQARTEEANKADKILGGNGVTFLGLREGKFLKEANEKDTYKYLEKIIKKEKPGIIFTHMREDPHVDHKDTLAIVKKTVRELPDKTKPDVYSFGIWNPFTLYRREPNLVVDISNTFKKKLKAMKCFKSQNLVILQLTPGVYIKAKMNGIAKGYKYAEVFRKVFID